MYINDYWCVQGICSCTKWTMADADTYYQILTCTRHLVRGTTLAVRAKSSVGSVMPWSCSIRTIINQWHLATEELSSILSKSRELATCVSVFTLNRLFILSEFRCWHKLGIHMAVSLYLRRKALPNEVVSFLLRTIITSKLSWILFYINFKWLHSLFLFCF